MKSYPVRMVVCAALLIGCSQQARAQAGQDRSGPGELVTDRPDVTESSEVVAPGFVQFESGLSYESEARDGLRSQVLAMPAALARIGLWPRTELRIGGDGFLANTVGDVRTSGQSDLELGMKVRLLDQQSFGIDLAVIPMVSLPTGANAFTSGGVDPTLKVTWARGLAKGFDLTGNFNIASVTDEDGRFAQRALTLSLGHDLLAGWGGFIETYAFTPMARGEATGVTLDWGLSHLVGANIQIDIEAGRGLSSAAPDWFFGFGFAVRGHR